MRPANQENSRLGTPLVLSTATVLLGVWLIIIGTAPPTAAPRAEVDRVRFTPTPVPVQPISVAAAPTPDCPQMDNPGGRLDWRPSPNPGPTPTNGTVGIPALGVNAPIVRVGIDSGNRMVVPKNARDIAWLDRGGIHGSTNNVVLAGHINYNRQAGSFSRLGQVQPGEEIVVSIDGTELRYRVIWNCLFPWNTDRAEQIMGYTEEPSVTLISCGGVFDRAVGTHNKRIAVRAELIEG